MKHLDVGQCWLQEELAQAFKVIRADCSDNASDASTRALSRHVLRRFLPKLGSRV